MSVTEPHIKKEALKRCIKVGGKAVVPRKKNENPGSTMSIRINYFKGAASIWEVQTKP